MWKCDRALTGERWGADEDGRELEKAERGIGATGCIYACMKLTRNKILKPFCCHVAQRQSRAVNFKRKADYVF